MKLDELGTKVKLNLLMYSHIIVKYNHPDQTALCPMYCDCDIVMLVSEQKQNSLPEALGAVKRRERMVRMAIKWIFFYSYVDIFINRERCCGILDLGAGWKIMWRVTSICLE